MKLKIHYREGIPLKVSDCRKVYGRRGWCSRDVRDRHVEWLWKAIRSRWKVFNNKTYFMVSNGRRVIFWKDRWYRDLCSVVLSCIVYYSYCQRFMGSKGMGGG